ncbi:hypothetical protein C4D60_Mb10t17460 [Musa balbisiana]|uniref:Uncharacterized protein n=1 Tax=Musa balbisiana TaxID=52838 RepID=A0A4S8IXV7_MUSBA|nr:hypothetical protein C4D60_Mb10t17460 [Musa balbisiana]
MLVIGGSILTLFYETVEMEKCPMRLNTTKQLCQDPMSEKKSRFWQINDQPFPRSEVICPQPHWVTRVPYFMEYCNRIGPNPKGILQIHRVDYASETLDLLQRRECPEGDGDLGSQVGLLCGSPPARTNNPVVRDAEFGKHSQFLASPIGVSLSMKQAGRVEKGSPNCGSSPEVRIEGFACGNSESHCAVPALA